MNAYQFAQICFTQILFHRMHGGSSPVALPPYRHLLSPEPAEVPWSRGLSTERSWPYTSVFSAYNAALFRTIPAFYQAQYPPLQFESAAGCYLFRMSKCLVFLVIKKILSRPAEAGTFCVHLMAPLVNVPVPVPSTHYIVATTFVSPLPTSP